MKTLVLAVTTLAVLLLLAGCGAPPEGGGPTARLTAAVQHEPGVIDPILIWDASTSTDSDPGETATFNWTVDRMPCFDILMGVSSNGEEFGILPTCSGGVWKVTVQVVDGAGRSDSATASLNY